MSTRSTFAALTPTLALAAAASAQVTLDVIAKSGQQVPGEAPGVVFARTTISQFPPFPQAFSDCTIDSAGRVTFISLYPSPQGPVFAVFRESSTGLNRLLHSGQPDTAHNNVPIAWSDVRLFPEGAAGGIISETTAAVNSGLARADPFAVPFLNGDPIAPSSTDTWSGPSVGQQGLAKFAFNRAGEGVFQSRINGVDAVGYIDSLGIARELFRAGAAPPNLPPFATATITSLPSLAAPVIGPDGTMAIGASVVSSSSSPPSSPWLFVGAGGSLFPVINAFDDVPGLPSGSRLNIDAFNQGQPVAAIAPDGHFASILRFAGPTAGISGALLYGTSAGVQAILSDRTPVPGLPIDFVVHLTAPATRLFGARGGAIVFWAATSPRSSSSLDRNAIIVGTPAGFHAIVQSGAIYFPDQALTVAGPVPAGINAFQDVLVSETLIGPGVTSSNNIALQVFPRDAVPITLLRTGDTLTLAPGDQRIVKGFNFGPFLTGYTPSLNSPINDSRQVAVAVDFTDNSGAIIRLTYPGSACRPDLDRSGTLTTVDIFEFITAWFEQEPRADFNSSGAFDTQDIFDFLNAWFAGC